MSNDIAVLQNNVPAHLQNNPALAERNKGALAGTGGGGVDRISLKQSRFRVIEGGEEVAVLQNSSMEVVVLRANDGISKNYYEKAWTPGQEAEAPTCYSDDGIAPSPGAQKPQCQTCADCPHNAWGSKINPHTQAESKACADVKKVTVVPAGKVADGKVYQLGIPAASLKHWGAHIRKLDALSPAVPYNAIVTKVAFDTDATYPLIMFEPVRYLDGTEFQAAESRYEAHEVKLCAGLVEAAPRAARQQIPGQNPATTAQQAVRDQGQAQADNLTQAQTQAPESNGHAPDPQAAQAQAQAQAAAQPQQAAEFGEQAQAEPAQPAQQQAPADDGFGGQAQQAAPQAQQQAPADNGFGEQAAPQAEPQAQSEAPPKATSLDDVFGSDW